MIHNILAEKNWFCGCGRRKRNVSLTPGITSVTCTWSVPGVNEVSFQLPAEPNRTLDSFDVRGYKKCVHKIAHWRCYYFFAGKSNLMDAISFVFGEKTSSLRVKTVKVCFRTLFSIF